MRWKEIRMSKYREMVAARRAFNAAWTAWLLQPDTRSHDVTDERDGTVSAIDQMTALARGAIRVDTQSENVIG